MLTAQPHDGLKFPPDVLLTGKDCDSGGRGPAAAPARKAQSFPHEPAVPCRHPMQSGPGVNRPTVRARRWSWLGRLLGTRVLAAADGAGGACELLGQDGQSQPCRRWWPGYAPYVSHPAAGNVVPPLAVARIRSRWTGS